MKRFLIAGMLLLATPLMMSAHNTKTEQDGYKDIHTSTLKKWYDQGKSMTVLDARAKKSFNNTLLPNAQWVPYTASEKEIATAVPSKSSLIVVYCWSVECPASAHLADRLVSLGYTNVYKYPEGLQGWQEKDYPVTQKE